MCRLKSFKRNNLLDHVVPRVETKNRAIIGTLCEIKQVAKFKFFITKTILLLRISPNNLYTLIDPDFTLILFFVSDLTAL